MIDDVWNRMSTDPAMEGYSFKKVGLPSPDHASMKKCRELCAQNVCGAYSVTWGCPPGVGREEECLKTLGDFSNAAFLIKEFNNIDLKDRELLRELGTAHQDACRRFSNALRGEGYRVLALTDGGCRYCGECSYPDDPCRFPDQRISSIAAYGIMMDEYMGSQNIEFHFRDDGMTLYGLIMYDGS
ncbi:MAG: DUF2284 domain-containing protein [Methanomassiliicoccaceae archaeon]|nr:DUF2284 domain-containing protein [Methanomassiliicoccaceae archaeon]